MEKQEQKYQQYLQILREELIPAMGCTEPISIAYAGARARELLGEQPTEVLVQASGNLIKNVKSVIVPNTGGLKGIEAAAAAGIVAGRAGQKLEVISAVTPEQQQTIAAYLSANEIKVVHLESDIPFDLILTVRNNGHYAKVRIAQYHTNIVLEEKDGETLLRRELEHEDEGLTDHVVLVVRDIVDFAETVDIQDVHELIKRQIDYNTAIAEEGLQNSYGANIGSVLLAQAPDDVRIRAKAKAAAGSDARMSGCDLPVIINSGSGNQGITVCVPVVEYARQLGVSQEKLYRALVLANLLAIHQKTRIGRLSAFCGAVSAGSASGAAICYLHGGNYKAIAHCLVNALAIASGMICDGAKPSCAAKIALAIEAGLLGFEMYQTGNQFRDGEGIVSKGIENTIVNIGRLGRDGMKETDKEILKIMTKC